MRLSRILRSTAPDVEDERIPLRRVLLWVVVGAAIIAGILLYFKYERQLTPIVS